MHARAELGWSAALRGDGLAETVALPPFVGDGRDFTIGEVVGALAAETAFPDDFWCRRPPGTNFISGDFAFLGFCENARREPPRRAKRGAEHSWVIWH